MLVVGFGAAGERPSDRKQARRGGVKEHGERAIDGRRDAFEPDHVPGAGAARPDDHSGAAFPRPRNRVHVTELKSHCRKVAGRNERARQARHAFPVGEFREPEHGDGPQRRPTVRVLEETTVVNVEVEPGRVLERGDHGRGRSRPRRASTDATCDVETGKGDKAAHHGVHPRGPGQGRGGEVHAPLCVLHSGWKPNARACRASGPDRPC